MSDNFENFSDSDLAELRTVFYCHAYEIIEDLQDLVLGLEAGSSDKDTLKTIKRHVHTLKGDSRSMGIISVGNICHKMEDILSLLVSGQGQTEHEAVDLLVSCVDIIHKLLLESESGQDGTEPKDLMKRIDISLGLNTRENNITPYPLPTEYHELEIQEALKKGLHVFEIEMIFHPQCREKSVAGFMVTQRLNDFGHIINSIPATENADIESADRIILVFSTKLGMEEIGQAAFITGITGEITVRDYPPPEKGPEYGDPENRIPGNGDKEQKSGAQTPDPKNEILRVEVLKIDKVMNLVGELIIGRSMIDQVTKELQNNETFCDLSVRLSAVNAYMERTLTDLQKSVMKMRMVPVNYVFRKFPKILRDLSIEKGKKIRLYIQGRETELDKGIVDALGDPLAHIIRNFVDHGIESPEERNSAGKPEEGVISLRAYHEAAHIVIEAADDGRGIDTEKLKRKALEKGFMGLEEVQRITDSDVLSLIFLSGLSTSDTVNETSGRGVGMDAVKIAVENMKGSIEVESIQGKGTKFRMRLPLTLAVIKALLFEVGHRLYALPVTAIAEVSRTMAEDLLTVDGKTTLMARDQIISIIDLQELFGHTGMKGGKESGKKFALLLGAGSRKTGFLVDRLLGQQELVIKPIDSHYAQSGFISGASILGDGKVVLILDAPALVKKAIENERVRMAAA
jgi:two-component system chemotaxis sensor kinase CheA